jgi:hypothetical protein
MKRITLLSTTILLSVFQIHGQLDTLVLSSLHEKVKKNLCNIYLNLLKEPCLVASDIEENIVSGEFILSSICSIDTLVNEVNSLNDTPLKFIQNCITYELFSKMIFSYNQKKLEKIGAIIQLYDIYGRYKGEKFLFWIYLNNSE